MRRSIVCLGLVVVFGGMALGDEGKIDLEAGKWSMGGTAVLPVFLDSSRGVSVVLDLQPQLGYFPLDNFEVSGSLFLKTPLLDSTIDAVSGGYFNWGAGLGARYYYSIAERWHLVGGVEAAMKMNRLVNNTLRYNVDLSVGALYALSDSWGIIVGVPVSARFSIAKTFEGIEIKPGYFGVRAFF